MDPLTLLALGKGASNLAAAGAAYGLGKTALDTTVKVGFNLLGKAGRMMAEGQSIRSLADYSRPARVEPLVIVEKGLGDNDAMPDVMKTLTSLFIGYWVQAATLTGTKVGTIDPLRVFDQLNPDRQRDRLTQARDLVWSNESYSEGLPHPTAFATAGSSNLIVQFGLEAEGDEKDVTPFQGPGVDKAADEKLYEVANLAVGKMVDVELKDGKYSQKFPVLFRLVPAEANKHVLTHIFTGASRDNSFKERYHLWRAGQISFVRDLMFMTDLGDEHRKALINDNSNIYAQITDRRRRNVVASSTSKMPSMADASNILVISKETARDMGKRLHGNLSQTRVRQRLFDSTYLILLAIVDEMSERVTIYHRGYDQATNVSFRDIKSSEKGKGPDLTEVLRMYASGITPTTT